MVSATHRRGQQQHHHPQNRWWSSWTLQKVTWLCLASMMVVYVLNTKEWQTRTVSRRVVVSLDGTSDSPDKTTGSSHLVEKALSIKETLSTTEGACHRRRGHGQSTTVTIPPVELRKGNRRKFSDDEYIASAVRLVDSTRLLIGMAKSDALPESNSTSLDDLVVMDYGCGPGRFLVGLLASGTCFEKYIGVDVGIKEIDWLTETYHGSSADASSSSTTSTALETGVQETEFIRVDVQNDRYNKNGQILMTNGDSSTTGSGSSGGSSPVSHIFTPGQTTSLVGTVDVMVLRSVFSHMRTEDIFHHLKALRPILKPHSGVMAVSLFVRPDVVEGQETVLSQEKTEQSFLHIVVLSKSTFERMVYEAGYHILLYTTLMGQETYVLAAGAQNAPQTAT